MKQSLGAFFVLIAPMLAQNLPCLNPSNVVVCINANPTREFGQSTLFPFLPSGAPESLAPNLVEGRELFAPSAIAFDASVTPPRVYIVDTGNNRVLAWKSADAVSKGNFADLVLGQPALSATPDFSSSQPYGPGTAFPTGLRSPTGIAVDSKGNVYVADTSNNRILRYPAPFSQQPGNLPVDLVIGQKTVNSGNQPNQNLGSPSATAVYLNIANNGQLISTGLAIDGSGNLWVADPGNNRVLRFPVSSLTANNSLPPADVALGQTSLTSNQLPSSFPSSPCPFSNQCDLNILAGPSGVAVDAGGTVYVTDQYGRAIQFVNPALGSSGSVMLGSDPTPPSGQTIAAYPNSSTLGSVFQQGSQTGLAGSPQCVFVLNGSSGPSVFVCDTPQNRVVRYDTFASTWKVSSPANSPSQNGVYGQVDFLHGQINQGQTSPSNLTLWAPVGGAIRPDNQEMWIVDAGNNRVVALANGASGYSSASRVLGQTDFIYNGVNLLEGRELWLYGTLSSNPNITGGGGIAIDTNSTPPHLYIADTFNNRILAFNDARNVGVNAAGTLNKKADLVIGQADLLHNLVNSPSNVSTSPTATGLFLPVGLAVDANGNLWVADSGNGRAVRFPAPFAQAPGTLQTANLVLGQSSLTSTPLQQVSQFNMVQPYGLTLFSNGSLAVSDVQANRVLIFNRPSGGDFTSGAGANLVVGQSGFALFGAGSNNNQLYSPRGLGVDSSDRLYVADYGNGRLIVFSKPSANNPTAALTVGSLYQISDVAVSFKTGYSWITMNSVAYQLPEFNTLQLTQAPLQSVTSFLPEAVALDPFDNVVIGEASNRVTFYFPELFYRNSANYSTGFGSTAGPTPTMLAELHLLGGTFNFTPSYSSSPANLAPPWPTQLNNLQVTVAGIPAPIFRIDTQSVNDGDILIEIPNGAPSAGSADFVITNTSTGQVYAAATLQMQAASPGLYTANASGSGPAAAINYKGTAPYAAYPNPINSASNPIARGDIIDLWLTGAGNVPGLPADGQAPGQAVYTPLNPTVNIGGINATVVGSAMSPDFPGVWQINAIVPMNVNPTAPATVFVTLGDYTSNIKGNGTDSVPANDVSATAANGLIATIYVK